MFLIPKLEVNSMVKDAPRYIRQYVDVDVTFDCDGRMRPHTLTWVDGHRFEIDRVLDVRPAHAENAGGQGDRYKSRVRGKDREIFFEHNPDSSSMLVGRWFIEAQV